MELLRAFLAAMASPTSLYGAAMNVVQRTGLQRFSEILSMLTVDFAIWIFGVMQALGTAPPMRIRLSGNGQRPNLMKEVNPAYPEAARANGIQGTVKLRIVLAKDGGVRHMELVSGDSQFVQAAIDAVKPWRYKPTLLNGQQAEVDTEVNVVFSLRN
jgi:TonB family protein